MRTHQPCGCRCRVEAANERGPYGHPVSVLTCRSPDMRLVVHGYVAQMRTFFCLLQAYALARVVVESALGGAADREAELHLYLSLQAARDAAATEPPFIHFPTLTMHHYPWNSLGHELTHFVSYLSFGGRSACPVVEESLATYFAQPNWRPHAVARAIARRPEAARTLADVLAAENLSERTAVLVFASFVGFLLEEYGLPRFRRLWRHPVGLKAAPEIYDRPRQTLLAHWSRYLLTGPWSARRDLRRCLSGRGMLCRYQGCPRCGGPLIHWVPELMPRRRGRETPLAAAQPLPTLPPRVRTAPVTERRERVGHEQT